MFMLGTTHPMIYIQNVVFQWDTLDAPSQFYESYIIRYDIQYVIYVGWFIKCITHITAGSSLHFHWTLWIIKWPKYNDILICSVSFISIVLERKISTRQTREELIRKGVLIPDQGEILNKLNVILSKHGWPLTISVILKQCSRPGVPNPAPGDRLSCKVQLQL